MKGKLHDYIIRKITKFLLRENVIIISLISLNSRFYSIRDIFIGHIWLDCEKSRYARENKPYGWNKVYSLNLTNIENKDINDLGQLHDVTLQYCPYLTNVSGLKRLQSVEIQYAPWLKDISDLSHLKVLKLFVCDSVRDINVSRKLNTLVLSCCASIRNISTLINLKSLEIYSCPNIDVKPLLKHLQHLKIDGVIQNIPPQSI